ncbi:MAG: polysaccharide biosynthesis tyrosine autokinase, partial [Nitrospirae bacterium]|nr:polysaccharide biosynthesis tyrosine autokinase [Nitrospirota bacterium]
SSPLIQNLRAQEIKVSGEVAELSDKYGPLHPKLARAKAELQDLRERIQHEVQKVYDSMRHEYDAALVRERTIKEAVGRHRHEKIGLEQYEIERGILEREAESNQHLFDIFLKLTKEADVLSGMRSASVYLADPAVPSSIPIKPRKVLNTALGLFLGLMSGFGTAMFFEFRKRILRVPDDVERFIPSISLLGVVPMFDKQSGNGRPLLSADSSSPVAESVRIIRTGLLMSSPNQLPACVLVTSPGESEGKTTLAVNLAAALSQLEDTRVLLLDVDFRKPTHHQIFGLYSQARNSKGLVDYLKGNAHLDEIIHRTDNPRLWVVPRGSAPERPSELLHSKRMTELLNWCRKEGYLVILDAPPVLPVADPVVLASKVDGVLLVVSSGTTTMEACRTAIQRLTFAGGKILGAVMQKAELRDVPYYYSYYSTSDR